jgi:hypothetical protein
MRRGVVVLGLAVLVSSAWHLRVAPAAPNAESALLDRTFTCSTALIGGLYQAKIHAFRGSGKKAGAWHRPAFAALSTTVAGSSERAVYDQVAWVSAGRPAKSAVVVDSYSPDFEFPMQSWGTLAVNAAQCRPASRRAGLGHRGLVARAVSPLDYPYDCAGAKVLVRIRAELAAPSPLTSYRGFLRTTQPAKRAILAVRTASGKALAYSEVEASGKTRLFVAASCPPD